jgi:hypothetical protein
MNKVVSATDGSAASAEALEFGLELAAAEDATALGFLRIFCASLREVAKRVNRRQSCLSKRTTGSSFVHKPEHVIAWREHRRSGIALRHR